jgi:myosin heavy subunit
MGNAIDRMQNSVLFLEQDKPYMSTAHAHNAVESLNQATIEMLRTAKSCTSGSGSGQQSQAMQMLQQMIPQQQDIVRETQAMMQLRMAEEALRQQRQAQLERLSGQQRSLQEVAKQIQESLKNNREALGKLDRTVQEMEAVANALNQGAVNEDLVNKEQRILSRLLDAERSVHTRDYEKQRESVTAEDVFSKSLGKRPDAAGAQTLRDEIQRAMQLKAPGEFEDLIRLYFRALAEEPAGDTPRSE